MYLSLTRRKQIDVCLLPENLDSCVSACNFGFHSHEERCSCYLHDSSLFTIDYDTAAHVDLFQNHPHFVRFLQKRSQTGKASGIVAIVCLE